ncbi:MAG: hypothetical protein ACE5JM_17995 [Armatimonadota bacterium]
MILLRASTWGLCALAALGAWTAGRTDEARAEAAGGPPAVGRLLAALRDGLAEHVVWLTAEERGNIERRMEHWLGERLRGGVPEQTLEGLAGELRGRPVPTTRLHASGPRAREEWLLRSVDALKRGIVRWLEQQPLADEQRDMARGGAQEITALFRSWLAQADSAPPREQCDAAAAQFERELLGIPEGCLWAPILAPPTPEQVSAIEAYLQRRSPPRWHGGDYQSKAVSSRGGIAARLWMMQTAGAAPTEEGLELARRREPSAEPPTEARALPDLSKQAMRAAAREEYARRVSSLARRTTVHPFLVQAFLQVRDSLEGRVLILP